jgi:anti-sigma B factor antagonist
MKPPSSSFRIDGEFTIYRAAELAAALRTALAEVHEGAVLDVDLSGVTEMDSAGVQLLVAARRSAAESGRSLRIAGRSAAVVEVFGILRLAPHFGDPAIEAH